jgi:prepilin-type N-terminal cleavage/methylation domain-containing protein
MHHAFTLIELMIVIAIIAIIAAIAIPNLLESRVSAQEAAAATALKSGILPAEVQFQAGAYQDSDGNGLGEYAVSNGLGSNLAFPLMSGATTTTGGVTLNLLAPTYQAGSPQISGYKFRDPLSEASSQERVWGVITQPLDQNQGRRIFAINQAGNIYASTPNVAKWVPYRR